MLESISDMISFVITCLFTLIGLYILFVISDKHHDEVMKKREEIYYSFYENVDDEYDDDEKSTPYYE